MRPALALDQKWIPAFAGMTLEAEFRRRVTGAVTPLPRHHKPPFRSDLSAHSEPGVSSLRVHPPTRGTDEVPVDVTGAVVARLGFFRLTSLRLL